MTIARRHVLLVVAIAVVAGAVVAGLRLAGSPSQERELLLDDVRVRNLAEIGRAVDLVHSRTGQLPSGLQSVGPDTGVELALTDPATGAPYDYRVLDGDAFELCATFQRDSGSRAPDFWRHRVGRQCFRLRPEEVRR
jgi:hypothetical protein